MDGLVYQNKRTQNITEECRLNPGVKVLLLGLIINWHCKPHLFLQASYGFLFRLAHSCTGSGSLHLTNPHLKLVYLR